MNHLIYSLLSETCLWLQLIVFFISKDRTCARCGRLLISSVLTNFVTTVETSAFMFQFRLASTVLYSKVFSVLWLAWAMICDFSTLAKAYTIELFRTQLNPSFILWRKCSPHCLSPKLALSLATFCHQVPWSARKWSWVLLWLQRVACQFAYTYWEWIGQCEFDSAVICCFEWVTSLD